MDIKKYKTTSTTITRDVRQFDTQTGNIYETVAMLAKRSDQISSEMKRELNKKIEEFVSSTDSVDEIYENREQIEVVRYYEQLPKPTLIAIQEYLNNELYYRNPDKERMVNMTEKIDDMIEEAAEQQEAVAEEAKAEK
ncbi:MAG: DNA-directed RNA polymerase subunit omega [Bacteroidales bacterium]|jgi:DNA-directed RNA polymerase subunit K/omega|nr:DNA-directed RNA polymerase subunit omega [Bacteroidales bacterium]MBP5241783.1 DNA-directed RNA polymerase subunit omega [Bacteroidales bacterium]MBP5759452.1 DNA-directed RNA polymerase subunit omega [Bacteroidales bacterium]